MFIKLSYAYTKDVIFVSAANIVHFSRGGGWTWVQLDIGGKIEVSEMPEEILALLAGTPK
jgi:hypothetical protein